MAVRKSFALALAVAGVSGPALAPSSAFAWDGPYAGISGGGGWGHQNQSTLLLPGSDTCTISGTVVCTSTINADGSYNLSGGLVGGTVGYNFARGRNVFGLEADASWADISGSGTCGLDGGTPHACGGSIRGLGTVRGRLGYDLGPLSGFGPTLAYVTGGLAVGNIHAWDALSGTSGSKTVAGWTIGGGLETRLYSNWSVKLEYLHVDFGDHNIFSAIPPNPERVSTTADIVRVGLNYHFNWGPAPTPPPPLITKAPRLK